MGLNVPGCAGNDRVMGNGKHVAGIVFLGNENDGGVCNPVCR